MAASTKKGWLLDLAQTSDEVLLLLAREARHQAAGDELTCRYWQYFRTTLGRRSAQYGLNEWDCEDAQQQAYFWIQEALRAYDFGQLSLPTGSSFRTFLHCIVQRRLTDFCRSLQRRRQRQCSTVLSERWWEAFPVRQPPPADEYEQPLFHLLRALNSLNLSDRGLWNELCQGKRLGEVAKTLGVSYRTVKRRWRRLRQRLASSTSDEG
jgi:RNA polymerase sigma factor (sigma-70 family)